MKSRTPSAIKLSEAKIAAGILDRLRNYVRGTLDFAVSTSHMSTAGLWSQTLLCESLSKTLQLLQRFNRSQAPMSYANAS